MSFKKHNQNPKGFKRSDCVIRAISFALGKDYYQVLKDLYEIGVKKATIPSDPVAYRVYLESFPKVPVMKEVWLRGGGEPATITRKRLTVMDLCRSDGTYIVSVANHLTCVKDGVNYDLYDCRHKSAYEIWQVN